MSMIFTSLGSGGIGSSGKVASWSIHALSQLTPSTQGVLMLNELTQ